MKNGSVLLELQRATHATLQVLVAELGLTGSEINALGNLGDGVARTVSELGAAVGAKPATLTGIVDRLEGRGMVRRGARAGDRRAVVIELTDDGREAAAAVRKALRALERRALAGVPDEEIDAARSVLKRLAEVKG
ncbi:MarR family winged helix-turn-helix transcriptional regulator [Allorhizocola rhizosphaerae]|uniref:MarR family winged helix-turn-helix transcriptional regulator n=1 Tax=Allorhizocola rhizosphaerae TaxID=1872709 RepID=UPI000E3ED9AD|nr:MarR family winged helix-turn-helix transcriptional regulator [Allorhizocola rhizosphaerae]